MMLDLVSVPLFLLPVAAQNWRQLLWLSLAGLALVIVALLVVSGGLQALMEGEGGANIGAGIVIYFAITRLGGGIVARILSLLARRAGHPRPWSLWIEVAVFFGSAYVLDKALRIG